MKEIQMLWTAVPDDISVMVNSYGGQRVLGDCVCTKAICTETITCT